MPPASTSRGTNGPAALLVAAAGLVLLLWGPGPLPLALAGGLVAFAAGLVNGWSSARSLTIAGGLVALLPGAYGVFGLAVVTSDWIPCLSQATASLSSRPGGYCLTTDWVRNFGFGGGLVLLGVLGVACIVLLLRAPSDGRRRIARRGVE